MLVPRGHTLGVWEPTLLGKAIGAAIILDEATGLLDFSRELWSQSSPALPPVALPATLISQHAHLL